MSKNKRVSNKTHTIQQLNDYANQHNPTSKAYKARIANQKKMRKQRREQMSIDPYLDWMCYSRGMYEFD